MVHLWNRPFTTLGVNLPRVVLLPILVSSRLRRLGDVLRISNHLGQRGCVELPHPCPVLQPDSRHRTQIPEGLHPAFERPGSCVLRKLLHARLIQRRCDLDKQLLQITQGNNLRIRVLRHVRDHSLPSGHRRS